MQKIYRLMLFLFLLMLFRSSCPEEEQSYKNRWRAKRQQIIKLKYSPEEKLQVFDTRLIWSRGVEHAARLNICYGPHQNFRYPW